MHWSVQCAIELISCLWSTPEWILTDEILCSCLKWHFLPSGNENNGNTQQHKDLIQLFSLVSSQRHFSTTQLCANFRYSQFGLLEVSRIWVHCHHLAPLRNVLSHLSLPCYGEIRFAYVQPSIHFLSSLSCAGLLGAGAYPSMHEVRGRVPPGKVNIVNTYAFTVSRLKIRNLNLHAKITYFRSSVYRYVSINTPEQ